MKARSDLVRCSLLATCLIGGFAPAVPAQGLKNVIPANQEPLLRTFPPTATEQTPSGTGKFVIFTRESVGKENEWDFIAGAWECIPSRPEVPVTKRVEFCHSSWDASPLLDGLVRDDSKDRFPHFVRLQVDASERDYTVNLYDIDYRTWEVRCAWQGGRLSAFGVLKENVFCHHADEGSPLGILTGSIRKDEWFCLDASTGAIRKGVPFIPRDVDGAYWLVRKNEEQSGEWSYDPARERFVGHFGDVEEPAIGHSRALLALDGRSRAWVLVPRPEGWRGGNISGTLVLQRDGREEDIRVPISMEARAGSGVPVIPIGTALRFTPDGDVEFTARQGNSGRNDRIWTLETVSGKMSERVRPHASPKADDLATFDGVPAPEYLRPYLKDFRHFGRSGLAPAFLVHMGVLKRRPEYPDCEAGVSRDGRHILYKAKKGALAEVCIYGDLQTKQTLRWTSPVGLKPGDSMEFVWVETP